MAEKTALIDLGIRRLQFVSGAYLLNFPIVAARSLNLRKGDEMHVSIMGDRSIRIEKIGEVEYG